MEAANVWVGALFKPGAREGDFCKLALAVPEVRKVKDAAESNERVRIRQSAQKAIHHIMLHPAQAVDIWSSIESKLCSKKGGTPSSSADGEDAVVVHVDEADQWAGRTFGRMSKDIKAKVMLSMPHAPTQSLMEKMDNADPHAIADAFETVFKVSKKDRIPKHVGDWQVFVTMMRVRMQQVGRDCGRWFRECVNADGQVDWSVMPIYVNEYNEDRHLIRIRHMDGSVAELTRVSGVMATDKFVNIASDEDAGWPLTTFVTAKSFFKQNQGPNAHSIDKNGKALGELVDTAKAEIAKRQMAITELGGSTTSPGKVLVARSKRMREEALVKARQKRASLMPAQRSTDQIQLAVAET